MAQRPRPATRYWGRTPDPDLGFLLPSGFDLGPGTKDIGNFRNMCPEQGREMEAADHPFSLFRQRRSTCMSAERELPATQPAHSTAWRWNPVIL